MSRKWTLLTLIFFLGSVATLQANPLDSPGIVYIDGLPCNRACQSYMAWSRPSPARHREESESNFVAPAEAEIQRVEHAARPRVARQPVPVPRPMPRAGMAASNAKPSNPKASHSKQVAAPKLADQAVGKAAPTATAIVMPEKAVAGAQEPERKLESPVRVPPQGASIVATPPTQGPKPEAAKSEAAKSEVAAPVPAKSEIAVLPATPEITASPDAAGEAPASVPPAQAASIAPVQPTEESRSEVAPAPPAKSEIAVLPATPVAAAGTAPASMPRTIQEQVVEATGMADRVTAITLEPEAASKSDNQGMERGDAVATDKTASGSPINPDNLVALVLARPEINSLSDLNNRNIAIEEKQSAASGSVSAALMAAGAPEVQFSEGQAGAIDRLISGEVPAAVLTLASREAAEWFPDIQGFRIFRVPLSPRARL
jgi:hypothetical protein